MLYFFDVMFHMGNDRPVSRNVSDSGIATISGVSFFKRATEQISSSRSDVDIDELSMTWQ
jgi:hypothetical protein